MTKHENLLHHLAFTLPKLPFHKAAAIALAVRAWVNASHVHALDESARIDEGKDDPDHLLKKFVSLRNAWGLDPSITVEAEDLVRVVTAILQMEGTLIGDKWSADPTQWAADPESPEVILAPWVADLMAFITTGNKPVDVYLPFETVGQLACRMLAQGATIAVESKTPQQVRLGLVTSGAYGHSVHNCDPVLSPWFTVGSHLKQYPAAAAVIPLRGTYLNEDLEGDIYHRFDHPSAKGSLAAIFHIVAQTKGRAVILVPDSLLFKPGPERGLRDYLLSLKRLEAVVGLPSNAVQGIKGACSILVLNNAAAFDQILFVKVTPELLMATGPSTPKIHQVGVLIRNREEGPFSSLMNVGPLLTEDLNLEASRHVTKRSKLDYELTTISEHFDLIRPRQHSMGLSGVPVQELQAQDIPAFGLVQHATKATVHELNGPNAQDYFLRPHDVLICIKGATGKVGCVGTTPLPGAGGWIAGQSVAVLRARDHGYLPQALMMYLRSPLGQAGLRRLVVGTSAPTIQAKALKGFQIPVLTAVQADMALEALEAETAIEGQIDALRLKQANISSFLWPT